MINGTSITAFPGGAVVNNKLYAGGLERVRDKLQTGILLSQALRETGQYPVLVTQLVATGEESGRVDALLRQAAGPRVGF